MPGTKDGIVNLRLNQKKKVEEVKLPNLIEVQTE